MMRMFLGGSGLLLVFAVCGISSMNGSSQSRYTADLAVQEMLENVEVTYPPEEVAPMLEVRQLKSAEEVVKV